MTKSQKHITHSQYRVLKFIIDYQQSQHIAPTGWEIADATFNRKSNAGMIVCRLKSDGWISRESNSPEHKYELLRDMPDEPVTLDNERGVDAILKRLDDVEKLLELIRGYLNI